jgi:AAA+ ATPase superfamily predicted ATPase
MRNAFCVTHFAKYFFMIMAREPENPILISGYISPIYFCNRAIETNELVGAMKNGRNITLLSVRRIGKTGLINNAFYQLNENKSHKTLYIDVFPAKNLADFVKIFSQAIVEDEHSKKGNTVKRITNLAKGIKASVKFNSFTGTPELVIGHQEPEEVQHSIGEIFKYLENQKQQYAVAFDEFQQILEFPEKNVEALLRSYIQQCNNVNFIFSGSNKHLLESVFGEYGRPFYQSTGFLHLNPLPIDEYAAFIQHHFQVKKKQIDLEMIKNCLQYFNVHTFYTQYYFNRLFERSGRKPIDKALMYEVEQLILKERENTYYSYRNLLTKTQFALLEAIAKETEVSQPTSKEFLTQYGLKQSSSVSRALQAMTDKSMVYHENGSYRLYDVFFEKWLQKM